MTVTDGVDKYTRETFKQCVMALNWQRVGVVFLAINNQK
jgi:hypothetical protein